MRLGLVGAIQKKTVQVAPFFVLKKDKRLRVVWDCRRANVHCNQPPPMDMGAGDALQAAQLHANE
eukprot:2558492-Lingulodinium_polyedra.AAC.1